MEYISKDDSQLLIDLILKQTYTLDEAIRFGEIRKRLKSYIDGIDKTEQTRVKLVDKKNITV